ncbi:hypothetical protein KF707_12730 [Candidatus Obscuribacterales bacterium]|nr:hypothetical protein [Candidatus Obscuribacterales bacterium]
MSVTLTVCEKSPGGPPAEEYSLELKEERITVRDLIQNIVFHQVYKLNTAARDWNRMADDREQLLNSKPAGQGRTVDWVPKFEQALKAFETNQIVLLVDDTQVEDLNEFVDLTPRTKVTFLKLVPLVGG